MDNVYTTPNSTSFLGPLTYRYQKEFSSACRIVFWIMAYKEYYDLCETLDKKYLSPLIGDTHLYRLTKEVKAPLLGDYFTQYSQ